MREPNCEAVRLLQLEQIGGKIARSLEVSPGTVSNWRNGLAKPPEQYRILLARRFAIPLNSWAQAPQDGKPPPNKKTILRKTQRHVQKIVAAPQEPYEETAEAQVSYQGSDPVLESAEMAIGEISSRAGAVELIKSLRTARMVGGILPSERVKLASAETRAIALLSKIDFEEELTEDKIVRHPKYQLMRRAILDTLTQYPAAGTAVLNTLKRIEEAKS